MTLYSSKIQIGEGLRIVETRFPINNEFLRGSMVPDPARFNSPEQTVGALVRHRDSSVPARRSANHVPNDVFLEEKQVALNLLVEF